MATARLSRQAAYVLSAWVVKHAMACTTSHNRGCAPRYCRTATAVWPATKRRVPAWRASASRKWTCRSFCRRSWTTSGTTTTMARRAPKHRRVTSGTTSVLAASAATARHVLRRWVVAPQCGPVPGNRPRRLRLVAVKAAARAAVNSRTAASMTRTATAFTQMACASSTVRSVGSVC